MKCGKCGNNEATFHYKSMVNGSLTELHLCSECAGAEEFSSLFDMGGGFDDFFGGDFFQNSFTRPFARSMNTFADPRRFFGPTFAFAPVFFAPYEAAQVAPELPAEAAAEKVPVEVDPAIAKRRELHALKFELKKAVTAEKFERAVELRDKIRELES